MINRLVKLSFREEEVVSFLEILDANIEKIRANAGCHHLEILQDIKDPSIFWTYSLWKSEEDLNNYRHSEFFHVIWPEFKSRFKSKPEVWSTKSIRKLS